MMTATNLYPSLLPRQASSLSPQSSADDIIKYIKNYIVYRAGNDQLGRPVIVLCLCNFLHPSITSFDSVLKVLQQEFSAINDQEYVAVIFATHSQYQPTPWWIWKAYNSVDRRYRKNVKQMYMVHPNNFLTSIISIVFTLISPKFARKLIYCHTLSSLPCMLSTSQQQLSNLPSPVSVDGLNAPLPMNDLRIPAITLAYDHQLEPTWLGSLPSETSYALINQVKDTWKLPIKSEFGVMPNLIHTPVPRSVVICAQTIIQNCNTHGIFRRTPMHNDVLLVKKCLDTHVLQASWPPHVTDEWDLVTKDVAVKDQTVLVAAALLTRWVRELPEPIIDDLKLSCLQASGNGGGPPSHSGTWSPVGDDTYNNTTTKVPANACNILFPETQPPQLRLCMAVIGVVLQSVAGASKTNDMPATNLARVWAVSLLRTRDPVRDMQMASDTDSIVHCIIKDWCHRWDFWFGELRKDVDEILRGSST